MLTQDDLPVQARQLVSASYGIVPFRGNAYGSGCAPRQWLLIGEDGTDSTVTEYSTDGSVTDRLYAYPRSTFFDAMMYGDTAIVDAALSDFPLAPDGMAEIEPYILTQACLRSYERRARFLLGLMRRKHGSWRNGNPSENGTTAAVVAEAQGVLACWEQLMVSGTLAPTHVLQGKRRWEDRSYVPVRDMESEVERLSHHMHDEMTSTLPYKVAPHVRAAIIDVFGLRGI